MMAISAARAVHSGILQTAGFVEYTICSRGQPIGTSDLDFLRIDGTNRSGWFHPNAFGESLMPTVALAHPAVRAFICQDVKDENGQSVIQPDSRHSTAFADLAEAYHRVAELDLTLHLPDGTLVPTTMLGIQDTEHLRKFARWRDTYPLGEVPIDGEPWYEELQRDLAELSAGWHESDGEVGDIDADCSWIPDEEDIELPRYQVHALLEVENAIP
jgi:hypothetical protein